MWFKKRTPRQIQTEYPKNVEQHDVVKELRDLNRDLTRDLNWHRKMYTIHHRELQILNTAVRRRNATIKKLRAALKDLRNPTTTQGDQNELNSQRHSNP